MTVAHPGPQSGLRQTRQAATTEHACCQFYTSLPSRQQSDVSDNVTLSKLCAVASDYNLQSAEVHLTPSDTLDLMTLLDVSLIHTCGCMWLSRQGEGLMGWKAYMMSKVAVSRTPCKEMLQGKTKGGRLCATPRHIYAVAQGNTAYLSIAVKDSITHRLHDFTPIIASQLRITSVCIPFGVRRWCGPEVVSPLYYEPDCGFRLYTRTCTLVNVANTRDLSKLSMGFLHVA